MTHTPPSPVHAPMPQFPVQGNELIVAGVPLSELAQRLGETPFYAYDRNLLRMRCAELRATLPPQIKVHYAMKANPMRQLLGFMVQLVDGIDVASGGELELALEAGAPPGGISFAGPGKREGELRKAIEKGILVNIESFREVRLLATLAQELNLQARVAVRVNPDFELKSAGMKMCGGPKPFGVDAEQVPELLKEITASNLTFEGFQLFAGSQNLNAAAICEAQQRSYELAVQLAKYTPHPVRTLNLGGGFGIPYFPGEQRLNLALIGQNLAHLLARAQAELPQAELVLELGRYLVGEAGIYVTRVIDRKISRGQTYLIVDGGLNHHLAASGNFGQVIRKNYPVAIGNRMNSPDLECVSIAGPLCTPLDLLADRMLLPKAYPGDLVVLFQSGAYGASASPQAFLGHPRVLEALV